jgi:hypothetical protein
VRKLEVQKARRSGDQKVRGEENRRKEKVK